MKVVYLPYVWIALFLAVLAGVLVFRGNAEHFAKGELGGVPLVLEYARTPEERERGLSGRTEIQDNYGMLFVFEKPSKYAFWMKDMQVPIDIFWLDENKHIIDVLENALPESYPTSYAPSAPALYVLETRAGFARDHAITSGDALSIKEVNF
jgi:uncharacterized protein